MALTLTILGGAIQLSGNPIWIRVSGASIPEGATGYKLLLRVMSQDGLLLGSPIAPDAIYPDANGEALFDISGIVDQPKTPVFEWPAVGMVKANPAAVFHISVDCGQYYVLDGEPHQEFTMADDAIETMIILKGGVSDFLMCEFSKPGHSFYNDWINTGKFLTNQPDNQKVSPQQIVKLWYITAGIVSGSLQGKWNIDIKLNDSDVGHFQASGDVDFYSFIDAESTNGITELSVSPQLVGIPGSISYTSVGSYTYWISRRDDNSEISERRTFIVDNDYKENNNYLFVGNSFNVIDVIWLSGSVQKGFDVTGTEGLKPKGLSTDSRIGSIVTTSRSGRRKWKINTGYKSAEEMEALIDVYLSRNMWLLIDGKIIPVILANGDKLLHDSMDDLHSADLELLEAHNTRFV